MNSLDSKIIQRLRLKQSWDPTYCEKHGGTCFTNEYGTCPYGTRRDDICCKKTKQRFHEEDESVPTTKRRVNKFGKKKGIYQNKKLVPIRI